MATNAIVSEGIVVEVQDPSGSPSPAWLTVGEIVDFDGPGGQATVIDASHIGSTFRDKLMGLPDEGQVSITANALLKDPGQLFLRTSRASRTLRTFRATFTDDSPASVATFTAYVLEYRINFAVDDKVNVNLTLEITDAVVWS